MAERNIDRHHKLADNMALMELRKDLSNNANHLELAHIAAVAAHKLAAADKHKMAVAHNIAAGAATHNLAALLVQRDNNNPAQSYLSLDQHKLRLEPRPDQSQPYRKDIR